MRLNKINRVRRYEALGSNRQRQHKHADGRAAEKRASPKPGMVIPNKIPTGQQNEGCDCGKDEPLLSRREWSRGVHNLILALPPEVSS